jgi:hypothetical protein
MIEIPSVVIIGTIIFFTLVGLFMIVLGITLYRRQSTQDNQDYVTQIKRPGADEGQPDRLQQADWVESIHELSQGAVHRGSSEMIPTEIGNLLNNIIPPISARKEPILPADVSRRLESEMLNGRNHLEDVNYGKIVPNFFVVEVGNENYDQNYEPIKQDACEQWQKRLLNSLNTANGRQGQKVYRFGGPVKVEVRPAPDLSEKEVRILSRIRNEQVNSGQHASAFLERLPDGKRWQLTNPIMTLGRSPRSSIQLESPAIQDKRLISNEHAYIRNENGRFYLFDGTPSGKRSRNGTFVNGRILSDSGHKLSEGDVIILASLDNNRPRPDILGSVGFIFHSN